VCDFEVDLALKHKVAGIRKLAMVYNGLADVGREGRADVLTNPPRLVMTARMAEPKDHATLITALAGLRHLPWELDLIGDGPLEEKLKMQTTRLGLSGRVHFRGFRDNLATELAAAQIFVLASRSEAFPYSILEAMRAGLPVVASNVGGIPEAVVEGQTGFLARAGDPEALADSLSRLITDPLLRQQLGNSGRERFLQYFGFEQMFVRTSQLYRDVLSEFATSAAPLRLRPIRKPQP
jgi:glycosyltransferase involved in cell wall biosynthesis